MIAHLAHGADAFTNLATWALTGQETPAYDARQKRDADIDATAQRPAAELITALEHANARLLEAFQALKGGVRVPHAASPSRQPGLWIIAGEGEEWTVGDGAYRIALRSIAIHRLVGDLAAEVGPTVT